MGNASVLHAMTTVTRSKSSHHPNGKKSARLIIYHAFLRTIRVRESLQNYGSKKYRAVATEYPAVVWRNEQFDPKNPWEGFGRNELMIKVSHAVTVVILVPLLI